MKNKIFKLFVVITLILSVIGCGNTRKANKTQSFSSSRTMIYEYNMCITNNQLDSICIADTLSFNFKDWVNTFFIDFTTRDTVYKHMYIKKTDYKNEVIYVVTEWRDSLAISKRITK